MTLMKDLMLLKIITISLLFASCAMTVKQPDLNLQEQKELNVVSCAEIIGQFDNTLKSLLGDNIDTEMVSFLRTMNADQLECVTDRFVECEAQYEGCRTKINGLRERFGPDKE